MIILGGGTAWILPIDTEEVHGLDDEHVAAIRRDGDIQVHESAGTVTDGGLVYPERDA